MHHLCRHPQFCSEVAQGHSPFPAVLVLDLVQVCCEEWIGPENSLDWDWAVGTGIEVAVLPPEIWAASVAVFSQDLSALDAVLNCGVECMVLEPSRLAGRRNTESLVAPLEHVLAMAATILPGSHPTPLRLAVFVASPGLYPWPSWS